MRLTFAALVAAVSVGLVDAFDASSKANRAMHHEKNSRNVVGAWSIGCIVKG